MKKVLSVLLILAMVFCFAACGSNGGSDEPAAADEDVTLVLANMAYGADNPYNIACKKAAELLEEMGSTVHLDLQLEAALGTEREIIENSIMGNIAFTQGADMSYTPFAADLAFVNFPLLFADYDDVYEFWGQDGWVFQLADECLDRAGLKLVGATDNGFRWITNSVRPIEHMSDIAGLKIRVPEIESLIDIWDAFGAVTAPISYTELTTALQQGVVDGQELGMQHFYTCGWYEYQPYATNIDYDYSAVITTCSKDIFNSLSEQQQADVMKAFGEASSYTLDYAVNFINEGYKVSEEAGVQILDRTEEMYNDIWNVGTTLANNDKWLPIFGEELVQKMYG